LQRERPAMPGFFHKKYFDADPVSPITINRFIDSCGCDCAHNTTCNAGRLAQLMLPNTNYLPSELAQLAVHIAVALAIGGNFCIPVFLVTAGSLITPWTTMPKTAVHKNNGPFAFECEVGLAKNRLVASPACNPVLPKYLYQLQLGRFVPARPDQGHNF
jgi:hypothetical protein